MTLLEAMESRHSVRKYKDIPITDELRKKLEEKISSLNKESGLNIQIVFDDSNAFKGAYFGYGAFKGVSNYIALVGKNDSDLQEKAGYFGEELVLFAQTLGLNTCWIALTFNKRKAKFNVKKDEKFVCRISLGYGETEGVQHKNRALSEICVFEPSDPEWFLNGVRAAMLAPTAMNQQKFKFVLEDENKVKAIAKRGAYTKLDLGIVKKHFELGAGKENFSYKD